MTKTRKQRKSGGLEHGRHVRFPEHLDRWLDEKASTEGFAGGVQFLKEIVRQAWLKDQGAQKSTEANAA